MMGCNSVGNLIRKFRRNVLSSFPKSW